MNNERILRHVLVVPTFGFKFFILKLRLSDEGKLIFLAIQSVIIISKTLLPIKVLKHRIMYIKHV